MRREGFAGGIALYLIGLVILGVAVFGGWRLWQTKQDGLGQAQQAQAAEVERGPRVETITVEKGPTKRDVTLLGDAKPFQSVTLYSKVGGYLRTLPVDKGDKVQAGQVVAEIDSAETDHLYASALADLENKKRLAARSRELVARQFTSTQAAEQSDTDERMASAKVQQLATMKSYETLRAPFAGTVTARFIDPGALVQNAETNQTSAQPVITIADSSRLRIYVHAEQQDVPFLHVGDTARVADAANPQRSVTAKITRTSGELDLATRTLLVEIDLDNPEDFLLPGSFVNVILEIPTPSYPKIPATALIMRGSKPFVATVTAEDQVKFRPVDIASTDGNGVNLAGGITAGERVAINLPSTVTEGSRIQPVASKKP